VLVSTVIIAALQSWHCLAFLYLGTYFAWLYLRFFQHQPETSIMGDPSEDFKFSSFFPAALAAPVDGVAGVCGVVFRLKHDPNAETKPLLPTAATGTLLGSNAVDANRRRCVLCGSLFSCVCYAWFWISQRLLIFCRRAYGSLMGCWRAALTCVAEAKRHVCSDYQHASVLPFYAGSPAVSPNMLLCCPSVLCPIFAGSLAPRH
jgi:hypothetical protein